MARLPARPPTRTGMSNLRPLLSVMLVNRNALRSSSRWRPRNCQRTSGCISVSLLILRSTTIRSPAFFKASICSWRSGYSRFGAGAADLPGFFLEIFEAITTPFLFVSACFNSALLLHAAAETIPLVTEYHAIGRDLLQPDARRQVLAFPQRPVVDADETVLGSGRIQVKRNLHAWKLLPDRERQLAHRHRPLLRCGIGQARGDG